MASSLTYPRPELVEKQLRLITPVDASIASDPHEKRRRTESETKFTPDIKNGDEALQLVGTVRTVEFSEEFNARLRRKLDRVIIPLAAAVYFSQYLDKTSLNYASIMGLPIMGQNYNLVSMAFYLGYLVWEFPTMWIAQKVRIAKYLGVNVVIWGIVLILHAVTTSFGAFFTLRFLLGMLESCVGSILTLLISMFYKKSEQGRRISWFYLMNGLTQIFGGFVAYGISFYSGHALVPYKIVYYLLGGLAILVGAAVIIWMPDSPVHAHFLTTEERIAALERVRDDQGGTENKTFKWDQFIEALTDVRTWLIVLTNIVTDIPNGSLSNFSNLVIRNFGYTSRQTLILATPSGLFGVVATIGVGWLSDKTGERMLPMVYALIPTIVGSAMLIALNDSGQKGALLFSIYVIGTSGPTLALVYAWVASNISGYTKKVTVTALALISFALGNIIGTETFLPKDAPDYIPGKISVLALLTGQIFICLLLRWINMHMNGKNAARIAAEKERRGWTEEDVERERQKHAFADLTDKQNMYFVYTK